jgi:hypothetical protein
METMKLLKQDYEVEEGHGADRHPYLKENNTNTYNWIFRNKKNLLDLSTLIQSGYNYLLP